MNEEAIGELVIHTAIQIHRDLGPGLLESVYEAILARELEKQGLKVERQVPIPVVYKGEKYEEGFRADIILNGKDVIELKSVERITGAHKKQLLTYLKLTGCKLGFLLNFGEELMKTGITRTVNNL